VKLLASDRGLFFLAHVVSGSCSWMCSLQVPGDMLRLLLIKPSVPLELCPTLTCFCLLPFLTSFTSCTSVPWFFTNPTIPPHSRICLSPLQYRSDFLHHAPFILRSLNLLLPNLLPTTVKAMNLPTQRFSCKSTSKHPLKQNHPLDVQDAFASLRVTSAKHSKVPLIEVLLEASPQSRLLTPSICTLLLRARYIDSSPPAVRDTLLTTRQGANNT